MSKSKELFSHPSLKIFQILLDVHFKQVLGDQLCSRFEHEYLLSVDLFTAPIYGPYPCEANRWND